MNKKAFSLIELSVVILIIGILIAGVTQGSRLVNRMRLSAARAITLSSPVNSIRNIVGWWETTLEQSFNGTEPEEDSDGDTGGITTWYDINPQSTVKNNATSPATTNNPGYSASGSINNLPTLRFNGSDHYLNFDGTGIANSNYTIFVVEQRSGSFGMGFMLSANTSTGNNMVPQLGYRAGDTLTWGQFNNDLNVSIADYNAPIARIHYYNFNSTAATPKIYHINGTNQTLVNSYGSAAPSQGLASYNGATFGFYSPAPSYYKGDISEIIIFNRALKNEERDAIEDYLGKKWGIRVL
jgi:prepilin-type N-terminal cleavage/methylation domain-containing protein